ncbi:hypothetical protein AADC60_18265 [Cytobacillus pseudoceanisediminis]|uniref:Uncharacterized protein n=1 Tax=Cytobacillus pseudoceanisediminis TaxID=3051614 RepID=A0ABZ2ZF99_9BACI|nr:hypothetical protein [Cytobacillus oceanisediminis]
MVSLQRALPEIVKIANDSVVQEHIEEHSSLIAKKRTIGKQHGNWGSQSKKGDSTDQVIEASV